MLIKAVRTYFDRALDHIVEDGEEIEVTAERAQILIDRRLVEKVEEPELNVSFEEEDPE